jgi:hypothetical protein
VSVCQALHLVCGFLPAGALPRIGTLSFHSIAGFSRERKSLSQFFAFSTKFVNTLILELLFITENVNMKETSQTFRKYSVNISFTHVKYFVENFV